MKLTTSSLRESGLQDLIQGTSIQVPSLFRKHIDLLLINEKEIIAFMKHRYLNDHLIFARVMIILNQLVRYYRLPVTLYCLSYRTMISQEKIYLTFKKQPIEKEN